MQTPVPTVHTINDVTDGVWICENGTVGTGPNQNLTQKYVKVMQDR